MKYLITLSLFLVGCTDPFPGKSDKEDAIEDQKAINYGNCYCAKYEGLYLIEKTKYTRISNNYYIYCNKILFGETRMSVYYQASNNKTVIHGKKEGKCE